MKSKELLIFYIIFWICGRVYIFAPTYYEVKIFHSIGLHFGMLSLVAYIIHISKQNVFFWKAFFVYQIIGLLTFTITQLSGDNELNAALWRAGVHNSALSKISGVLGKVQDLFLAIYVFLVIVINHMYSKGN